MIISTTICIISIGVIIINTNVNIDISEGNKTDRTTTIAYKSDQKRDVFQHIEDMAIVCNLHRYVVNAAKEE